MWPSRYCFSHSLTLTKKLELEKFGLKLNDLESFAQTVRKAKELGYDAQLIGSKLAYWDELQKKQTDLEFSILELEGKKANLEF